MHSKRTATPAKTGKLLFAQAPEVDTLDDGWQAAIFFEEEPNSHLTLKVLSKGVSLARLHTPHDTLLMRTELTQAKLKPSAKDMQTRTLSLVIRMLPCKNTHMHMHMYVHCLQFQAPTSFSVSTHVCA